MKPEVELGLKLIALFKANTEATHWVIGRPLWSSIRRAKDDDLRYICTIEDMIAPVWTLLGLPVQFSDNPDELRLE